jgi:hypothetical protein
MCETSSPARRNMPTVPGPQPDAPHAGFRSAHPEGADAPAATPGPLLVNWPKDLVWDEFRQVSSKPENIAENATVAPVCISGGKKFHLENGEYRLGDVKFTMKLVRANTWVVKSARTDELLAHEQGHYDIAGLCNRDMVAEIRQLRNSNKNDLVREANRIMIKHEKNAKDLSESYDSFLQTDHGHDKRRQKAWQDQITRCRESGEALTIPP